MWIVLSIITIYAWLFKQKRKTIKHQVQKIVLILLIIITAKGMCRAQNEKVIILGEIQTTVQNKGKIIVFLVDETCFKAPQCGLDTIILKSTDKIVEFQFKAREKGVYGIRCIHDLNSNGKLDKGMFGPIEPYGFSWKTVKKFPFRFCDISFTASSDKFITIKLEE